MGPTEKVIEFGTMFGSTNGIVPGSRIKSVVGPVSSIFFPWIIGRWWISRRTVRPYLSPEWT